MQLSSSINAEFAKNKLGQIQRFTFMDITRASRIEPILKSCAFDFHKIKRGNKVYF